MENLFENFIQKKGSGVGKGMGKNRRAINTQVLYKFSRKCDDIKWGCDWMTFVSMDTNSLKTLCPCFNRIVNDTNSDQLIIPGNEINNHPFESISIKRLTPNPSQEYFDIFVVYEGETYHIMQFGFYRDAIPGNKIMADFKIYGQCFRLQTILDGNFFIPGFVPSLLTWGVIDDKSIQKKVEDAINNDDLFSLCDSINEIFDVNDDNSILEAFSTYYLTRYDFRIDFFHPDRNFVKIPKYDAIKITRRKHGDTPFDNFNPSRITPKGYLDHDYTGYTVGRKKDKYAYLRFYHKQVDIFRTGEKTLYYDYIKYSGCVWRLEFQFGSRFTVIRDKDKVVKYNFGDAFAFFHKRVFEYLGIDDKTSPFSRVYNLGPVPFNEKSQFQKQVMIGQFASIADNFVKSGINPHFALDASLIMKKDYTQDDIDKLHDDYSNNKSLKDDTFFAFGVDKQ